jgi:hypothetical protein
MTLFRSFESGQIVSLKIIYISVRHLDKWNNAKYFGGTFASLKDYLRMLAKSTASSKTIASGDSE